MCLAAACETATVKKDRDPDAFAFFAALAVVGFELGALFRKAGQGERSVHETVQRRLILDDLANWQAIALMQKIAATKLDRIDAQFFGGAAHVQFHGEDRLRRAEAAECAIRDRIGLYNLAPDSRVAASIGP